MSLRVWLPLNGDLRNLGCSYNEITLTTGNSWISEGKIGQQALILTKLQTILPQTSCMKGAKQLSYAYWVKVNTAWTANWLDGIRWYSINEEDDTIVTSRQEFYNNCTRVGTWFAPDDTGINGIYNCTFIPGQWTHLAGTFNYNTGEASFYINGVLQKTVTSLNTSHYCRGDFYIGDNGVDISMNDVRIYDHCLSAAEVHEITQGLVVHYKFDDNYTRAYQTIRDGSGYGHHSSSWRGWIQPYTRSKIRFSSSILINYGAIFFETGFPTGIDPDFTIVFWVMLNSRYSLLDSNPDLIGIYNNLSDPFRLILSGNNVPNLPSVRWINGSDIPIIQSFPLGSWHHIAIVGHGDTKQYEFYMDGNKIEETHTNNISWEPSGGFYIGDSIYSSVSEGSLYYFSDFRIYCTALSDKDIKSLYNTSMKIDNLQNIHTFELIENKDKISIKKTGQLTCDELNENTAIKLYKSGIIETAELIER